MNDGADVGAEAAAGSGRASSRGRPVVAAVVPIFLAFAFAYFLSALLRAVTATLAPVFSAELGLRASDLGLLAGAYFLGFAMLQLPLGAALDRFGPKRVLTSLLVVAAVGCAAFAAAQSLASLFVARMMIGVGVSAALMAPLTAYRLILDPRQQLRANSWMLMTGSLGMVASTLPVQWLLPTLGWRGLFVAIAGAVLLAVGAIRWVVPADPVARDGPHHKPGGGYRDIVRAPVFLRSVPIGFFTYGGLIAVQALWAGPWLTRVAGWSAAEAAAGLFVVNMAMLLAFMSWGAVMPALAAKGVDADRLMVWGLPLNLIVLAWIVVRDEPAGAAQWALWCVTCTFVAPSQPAIGLAFPSHLAGRALSAYNLVIFGGVFAVQWGIGLGVDTFAARGMPDADAFRAAFGVFGACGLFSYAWYAMWRPVRPCSDGDAADNRAPAPAMTTRVVIVAHAPLASSLRAVALHTYPEHDSTVSAVDVQPVDSPQDVENRLRALIGATPGSDVLILADTAGATPCKAALSVVDGVHSRVVAGVNVPMLWRVLCYSGEPLPELVVRAVNGGTQGVLQLSTTPPQVQSPAPPSDDQEQHHHQQ